MASEIWKPIPGYEGLYDISSAGRVRSYKNSRWGVRKVPKIINGLKGKHYMTMILCNASGKRTFYVHRLVADVFIPKQEGKTYVNHINGNKLDNRVQNLEWCTQAENLMHADASGLACFNRKAVICLETGAVCRSVTEMACKTGISRRAISNCLAGRSKTAGKLHFQYEGEKEHEYTL